jgi:hypothetical protein
MAIAGEPHQMAAMVASIENCVAEASQTQFDCL